eukprot:UN12137
MCAARLCELAVVSIEDCYFKSNESSHVTLFLTNYKMNIHQLLLDKTNAENQDLVKEILSMNAVLFMIKSEDELSKLEKLITNPLIRYNNLLSVNLCYVGGVIPKWIQTFGDLFEISVHEYSQQKEMEIKKKILKECDIVFKIQRQVCLKKIASNPLDEIKIGINISASDCIISCLLALMALFGAIIIKIFFKK